MEIFNSTGYVSFGEFQVHVIRRIIELCIHEPFGEVIHPHCGHGSNDITNIFIKDFGWVDGELIERKGRLDGVARKPTVDEIPQMIVDHINVRARNSLEGKSLLITKGQMEYKLIVMGLAWLEKLCCLVHRSSIRKQMDTCNTEHMLCMVYVMYQNTFPTRMFQRSVKWIIQSIFESR